MSKQERGKDEDKSSTRGRDAKTGQFTSIKEDGRPYTSVVEKTNPVGKGKAVVASKHQKPPKKR